MPPFSGSLSAKDIRCGRFSHFENRSSSRASKRCARAPSRGLHTAANERWTYVPIPDNFRQPASPDGRLILSARSPYEIFLSSQSPSIYLFLNRPHPLHWRSSRFSCNCVSSPVFDPAFERLEQEHIVCVLASKTECVLSF